MEEDAFETSFEKQIKFGANRRGAPPPRDGGDEDQNVSEEVE